jgi:GNAT superfamily N-acetyltransferase
MELICRTLCDCTCNDVAAASVRVFADYVIQPPPLFDGPAFDRRYGPEHLDRAASQLVTCGGDPVAIILIARRGRTSHVSGLGVAPPYRNTGIAKQLLTSACQQAKARGDIRMLVEVLTIEAAALRLYESIGFLPRRSLVGYTKDISSTGAVSESALEVDPGTVAQVIASEGRPDLPWFLQPATLYGCSFPTRAYELEGRAYAVATLHGSALNLRALFVRSGHRRQGLARRLIETVAFAHSATVCNVLPFVPEGLCDDFFVAMSFQRSPFTNHEMELSF